MFKQILLIATLLMGFATVVQAQIPQQQVEAARNDLKARGIDDKEVERRLIARGFDPNNVRPDQIEAIQQATKEIIADLEREKAASASKSNGKATTSTSSATEVKASETTAKPIATPNPSTDKPANDIDLDKKVKATVKKASDKIKEGVAPEEAVTEATQATSAADLPRSAIFGQAIFRQSKLEVYRQTNEINTPDGYELGAGDKLAVSIWGLAVYNQIFEVNGEGFIKPDGMSRIYLKGKTFADAKKQLASEFGRFYPFSAGNFDVTLVASRTLSVNITGEVFNFGTFRLLALNSAFNALVAAGGPTDIGSVRNIKLIHTNGKVEHIDVYDFLLNPSESKTHALADGDNLFVPVAERLVLVEGAINRPFKYELVKGEGLFKLIDFAGGLSERANSKSVSIRRFEGDKEVLINLNLDDLKAKNSDFDLKNGDRVFISPITIAIDNFVKVFGAVHQPSDYEWKPNMKVKDALDLALLRKEARLDYAYLLRANFDGTYKSISLDLNAINSNPTGSANIELRPRDVLQVLFLESYVDAATVSVTGAVRKPISVPFDPSATQHVSDLVVLGGGLQSDAFEIAYLIRPDLTNRQKRTYKRFNVRNAVANVSSIDNIALNAGDTLRVFSRKALTDSATVRVEGAVRRPGVYLYDETLTLEDAILLSDGMKLEAASNRIEISRVELNENQPTKTSVVTFAVSKDLQIVNGAGFKLSPFDIVTVRTVPDFKLQQEVRIDGEVVFSGVYSLTSANERLSDVIKRAGGLTLEAFAEGATLYRNADSIGFVVLRLDDALARWNDKSNFVLLAGDVITIPKRKDFVAIQGETRAREVYASRLLNASQNINVAFTPRKRALYYVKEYAAGVGENGSARRITVVDANGEIHRTKTFGVFRLSPRVRKGSTITVGHKPLKKKDREANGEKKEKADFGKIFGESLAQATGILSLILLVQQISK